MIGVTYNFGCRDAGVRPFAWVVRRHWVSYFVTKVVILSLAVTIYFLWRDKKQRCHGGTALGRLIFVVQDI